MRAIVIYTSKTGFTKQYAKWIGEALSCEVITFEEAKKKDLNNYDKIIYGGSLLASKIRHYDKFKELFNETKSKWIIYATGITSTTDKEKIQQMVTANQLEGIPFYYYVGGVNYAKVGLFQKMILKAVGKSAKKEGDEEVANRLSHSGDYTNKKDIDRLIEEVKQGH